MVRDKFDSQRESETVRNQVRQSGNKADSQKIILNSQKQSQIFKQKFRKSDNQREIQTVREKVRQLEKVTE